VTRFWHPFADMGVVEERGELVFERAEGSRLWDEQGRSYIDATAALWYCNVGYGRAEIAEAAAAQMRWIPARGGELEDELAQALEPLAVHPLVSEIRSGTGAMAAVQLADPSLAERASLAAREHGVVTRVLLGGALQISPPLVITRPELDELSGGLAAALDGCREAAAAV
jgi:adenosylmethionine-8-amino-7-oxononanoate aminotransferase